MKEEVLSEVLAALKSGASCKELANKYGFCVTTIRNVAKKHGIKLGYPVSNDRKELEKKVCFALTNGKGCTTISTEYGIAYPSVYYIARKYGLATKEKDALANDIINDFNTNLTVDEIATKYKRPVSNILKLEQKAIKEELVRKSFRKSIAEKSREEKNEARKNVKLDDKTIEFILSAVANGASYNSVGKMFNMAHGSIKWLCDKHGIKSSHKSYNDTKKLTSEEIAKVIEKAYYGTPISVIASEFNVFPLTIERCVKKSIIGEDIYPLTETEKAIFSDVGKISTEEIAFKYGLTINRLRTICSDRNVSICVSGRQWSAFEDKALFNVLMNARNTGVKWDRQAFANDVNRTVAAVSMRADKMKKKYPFLVA